MLGRTLSKLERWEESEKFLLASYEQLAAAVGADHGYTRRSAKFLETLYAATDRPDDAELWRSRADAQDD